MGLDPSLPPLVVHTREWLAMIGDLASITRDVIYEIITYLYEYYYMYVEFEFITAKPSRAHKRMVASLSRRREQRFFPVCK